MKFWAWEEDFYSKITDARDQEAIHLSRYRTLQGFIGQMGRACPPICTFCALLVYSFVVSLDEFSPDDVFATVAIFQALRAITIIVPVAISMVRNIKVSTERLENFLLADEQGPRQKLPPPAATTAQAAAVPGCVALLDNATIGWPSLDEEQHAPLPGGSDANAEDSGCSLGTRVVLRNAHLRVATGTVTGVIGAIGSGKSTLLSTVVGERTPISGRALSTTGPIGFVPQRPFIIGGTVRENILFGRPEHAIKLAEVLEAAALSEFVSGGGGGPLPKGLDTIIGERGQTLSGGQQQRISIARALYGLLHPPPPADTSDAHDGDNTCCEVISGALLVMDDPLSAVSRVIMVPCSCCSYSFDGFSCVLLIYCVYAG